MTVKICLKVDNTAVIEESKSVGLLPIMTRVCPSPLSLSLTPSDKRSLFF